MGWKDLLNASEETLVVPWVAMEDESRSFETVERVYQVMGKLPTEPGWHRFRVEGARNTKGSKVRWLGAADPESGVLHQVVRGYLVGDRLVPDDAPAVADVAKVAGSYERVHLLEDGLDRFVRVKAGRLSDRSPLVYLGQEFPLGPEEEVLAAYLDDAPVDKIPGLSPALHAAYRMEVWQRAEAARRREEAERRRREEEERRALAERRQKLVEQLGDGAGRREMAKVDFGEAARAALAVGGATYLDHRKAVRPGEMAVRFRFINRRFECTCDARTLQIIDAGICLVAHDDDGEFDEGTRGDTWLSLESLPPVIRQADREHKLVIFRHVD